MFTVLVTRPKPQGEILCQWIEKQGAKALYFPTIEIVSLHDSIAFTENMNNMDQQDWLIFTSPQAVYQSMAALQARWPSLPEKTKIAAIGMGTALALRQAGLTVAVTPEEWNSEGLLALSEFQAVVGKKITLICGEGGRELLHDTFRDRGALVSHLIAYRRSLPMVDVAEYRQLLKAHKIDVIVCASCEAIKNLKKLLGKTSERILKKIPLIVASKRIVAYAKSLGLENIRLAKNASHEAMVEQIGLLMLEQDKKKEKMLFTKSKLDMVFLLIVFGCMLGGFSYYFLTRMAQLESAVMHNENHSAMLLRETHDQVQHLQSAVQTLQVKNQDGGLVAEVRYLIQLANDHVQLDYNIPLAIQLLQAADHVLAESTDTQLSIVRKTVASDLAALQAVPEVDMTGIYLQLAALNGQLEQLPLIIASNRQDKTNTLAVNAQQEPWWQRGLQQSWQGLKKIIVVRYYPADIPPLLALEQRDFLYQNIHAIFEKAMWATLHRQPIIYRMSLQQAMQWINQYFSPSSPATQAVLNSLNQLQQIDIHPKAPNVLNSLQMIQDYSHA